MDERRMIARILDGHIEEYGCLMERYGAEVFRLVVRLVPTQQDAEELVQDTFVRAYDRLPSYLGEASFSTWVCRIAYHLAVSWLRKRKLKFTSIDEHLPQVSDTDVDQLLDDDTRIGALREACTRLTPDEQTLVNLFYYDGKPLRDIAYIVGMEPGGVATRLHRIRKKLYLIIKQIENNDR